MSILTGVFMMLVPVVTLAWVGRRGKLPWGPLFLGAGMFLLAQVLKLPFLPLITAATASPLLLAIVSALAPGICEEVTKWAPLKWITRPTDWKAVLAFGIGFGGIECVYVGLCFVVVGALTAAGSALPQTYLVDTIKEVNFSLAGIALGLLSVFERVCGVAMHTFFAALNAQAIRTRRIGYFGAAMVLHTAVDFGGALSQQTHLSTLGALVVEAVLGVVAWFGYRYVRQVVEREWAQPGVWAGVRASMS